MRFLCRYIVFVFVFVSVSHAQAQSVNMPVNGFNEMTTSHVFVYDDGGPTGNHSSSCNGTYTFHTVGATSKYYIVVNSLLTHPTGNARLQILDGDTSDNYMMMEFPLYGSYYEGRSNSNTVTITFVADDDYPTGGFQVELCEYGNYIPFDLTTEFPDSTSIIVNWIETDHSLIWIFDYAFVDSTTNTATVFVDSSNFTTLVLDTSHVEFFNVPPGSGIICRVYSSDTSMCRDSRIYIFTPPPPEGGCNCVMAMNVTITPLQDSIRLQWDADDSVQVWNLALYGFDTTLDGSVTEITFPYDFPCGGGSIYIIGNCGLYNCNGAYYFLPAGGCQSNVGSINLEATTGSTVTISWSPSQNENDRYLLFYRPAGQYGDNILVDTLDHDVTQYTVTGLSPHTRYFFTIHVLCGGTTLACSQSVVTISTTLDNCIDFINFNDVYNVHRTWGNYDNPMQYTFGSNTRHVVMFDTAGRDAATGGQLRLIPQGEEVSLRLGDNDVGALAETITYDYEVDSTDKDMLVLRFAVVMQNPNHTIDNQPHFSMEIMDANGDLVDTNCCFADFSAAGDLGWNSVEGSNVIWKDWTTVGIDIARFHGQRIKIRFTTKDCADGGHYGYAYFTVHCDSKRIALVNLCDHGDSVRLRVPEGFVYRWTRVGDTTLFSTENEIVVPADTTEYICYASFLGNPQCSFTVRSWAVLPQVKAAVHYSVDTCRKLITFFSDSYVDIDSLFRPYVRQTIDSVLWIVEGDTLYGDSVSFYITDNKVYHLKYSCKLDNSDCIDFLYDSVDVDFFYDAFVVGDTVGCEGDRLKLMASLYPQADASYQWSNGNTSDTASYLLSESFIPFVVVSLYGCSDTLFHPIDVYPHFSQDYSASICANEWFDSAGFHENTAGVHMQMLHTVYGCDSLLTLYLDVRPVYVDTLYVVTCDESYRDDNFDVDSSGYYIVTFHTVEGCDSVKCLDFDRHLIFRDTIFEEIYYGDTYVGNGFEENETGFYEVVYQDVYSCDSIMSLDLLVVNLRFPNAVTPNGDGINDIMEIPGLLESSMFDYVELWVFDRWGKQIFHTKSIHSESDFWNPDATDTPTGTYFYRFHARSLGHEINHKSVIEVIR